MSTHYITCAPIAVLGGFLVVVSQAFAPATLEWVAAGVAIGVIVIAVLWAARRRPRPRPADSRRRDRRGRRADRLRPRVPGTSVVWLTFAFALGVVPLAFARLSRHEASNWRAQHQPAALRWLSNTELGAAPRQSWLRDRPPCGARAGRDDPPLARFSPLLRRSNG
jgi:hypothetical protein